MGRASPLFGPILKLSHPALIAGFAHVFRNRRKWVAVATGAPLAALRGFHDHHVLSPPEFGPELTTPFRCGVLIASWPIGPKRFTAKDAVIHRATLALDD